MGKIDNRGDMGGGGEKSRSAIFAPAKNQKGVSPSNAARNLLPKRISIP
jgi:hypothetical protein